MRSRLPCAAANPDWKVFATGEAVVIECDAPTPNLPAVLALPRYGIAKRTGGKVAGSGPFAIDRWDPGKKLTLTARDDYWGGRAFLDSIEIEMGKSFREQMIALDLGKADMVEVAPDQARHAVLEGRRVESSAPAEWMALVFSRDIQSAGGWEIAPGPGAQHRSRGDEQRSAAGRRRTRRHAPAWLDERLCVSFSHRHRSAACAPGAGAVRQAPAWTLGYDASDPLARVIAERIALNARDAGLTLQTTASSDRRHPTGPHALALARCPGCAQRACRSLGLPQPKFDGDPLQQSADAPGRTQRRTLYCNRSA